MTDSGVRYAHNGDVRIAYRTFGDGPIDLLMVPGALLPIEAFSGGVPYRRLVRPLTAFARVVVWDQRGTGLSDPLLELPTADLRPFIDDAFAVMEAAGVGRAAMFSPDPFPAALALSLAALDTTPVSHLVLLHGTARVREAPGYEAGSPDHAVDRFLDGVHRRWGTRWFADLWAPSLAVEERERLAEIQRRATAPRVAEEMNRWFCALDLRPLLESIRVPTLVLHRSDVPTVPIDQGRYLAEHISDAYFVELEGRDMLAFAGDGGPIVREIGRFLTGSDVLPAVDTSLRAVLFTDVVGSTSAAASTGDMAWRDVIEEHDAVGAELVRTFSGELVKTTGDGVLATFDSVANAIACAAALRGRLSSIGLRIRAGCHVGDVALREGDVSGSVVNVARRICDLADDGSVFVSGAVPPALAGSAFVFTDRGPHKLKGVPGEWRLFEVVS